MRTCSRWEIVSRLKPPFLLRLDVYRMIKHTYKLCEALMETGTNSHAFLSPFFGFSFAICMEKRKKSRQLRCSHFAIYHFTLTLIFYLKSIKTIILFEASILSAQHKRSFRSNSFSAFPFELPPSLQFFIVPTTFSCDGLFLLRSV